MTMPNTRIGTAGWSIPRPVADRFPAEGSALERYAAVFDAVEINSTFYRSHRGSTYSRWAMCTPARFRFSVKAPREITHHARLLNGADALARFLSELDPLRAKLEVLLVQLPPSLVFDSAVAEAFFGPLRKREYKLQIACEPRHESWFSAAADSLLSAFEIARVAADPAVHPSAGQPGGWTVFSYFRLHGTPRMYYSTYGPENIGVFARSLEHDGSKISWCIFDNTALGAAAADGLELRRLMSSAPSAAEGDPDDHAMGCRPARSAASDEYRGGDAAPAE
jgi:uncharacterized protein YecE (DUF72 family)